MKKFLFIWLVMTLCFAFVGWLEASWDMWAHSWMPSVIDNWKWYNYFTSEHSPTVLYVSHIYVWLGLIVGVSAFGSALISSKD